MLFLISFLILILPAIGAGTGSLYAQAASREQQLNMLRLDKKSRLWPERTAAVAKRLNKITERGFLERTEETTGTNGFQAVLGGMRSGSGASFGAGYRRSDLLGDRLGFRTTARGTIQSAYMFDLEVESPRLRKTRGDIRFYSKYENSPLMDYYGPGPNSQERNRSSYRLEDFSLDLFGRYRLVGPLYVGATVGGYFANTGPGQRDGFPTTDEKFPAAVVPGLGDQTNFFRFGTLLQYDWRDVPTGPRAGGHYYAHHLRYRDQNLGLHDFDRLNLVAEQYLPYWNKTNVLAMRLGSSLTWTRSGQTAPFYLEPTLGGNDFLRGFARYRFYGQNSIIGSVEHRWHLFSGGYAALFFEAGKVTQKATQLNFGGLEYSGGIGFRFTLRNAVIMRIDNAVSREGYRLIWTFSDMWRIR